MYCPRCGHQTTSEELRFCSYCGLKLGVVKASLIEAEEVPASEPSKTLSALVVPRQRDINIGVILMFAAGMFASFFTISRPGLGRETGAFIFAIAYLALVIFSGPIVKGIHKLLSWGDSRTSLPGSRKGMGFGATLMFLSTVALAVSSLLMYGRMKTTPFFIGVVAVFALLLLLGQLLMRGLRSLFQEGSTSAPESLEASAQTSGLASAFEGFSLPAGQSNPVPLFGTHRVTTAEIVTPSSVTEHTTNLLENK